MKKAKQSGPRGSQFILHFSAHISDCHSFIYDDDGNICHHAMSKRRLQKGAGYDLHERQKMVNQKVLPFDNVLCIALQRFIKYSKDVSGCSHAKLFQIDHVKPPKSRATQLWVLLSCFKYMLLFESCHPVSYFSLRKRRYHLGLESTLFKVHFHNS